VTKKPLSEQVVVVTGASSGLGRAIARGAGERCAKVVVTARNAEALDNAVREIEAFGSEALAVPADHSVQDEVAQVNRAGARPLWPHRHVRRERDRHRDERGRRRGRLCGSGACSSAAAAAGAAVARELVRSR
jgi:NAD(P)-dependent dehydrogenase (short-subunit alcohol dehydrogenase family)